MGTIQPIPEIGAICKKHGVLFHTDAVQAVGNVHIDVKEQNIDMPVPFPATSSTPPRGVGALYIRTGVVLPNFIDGGAQERGKRGGTENVASIVGLATAMEQACSTMDQRVEKLTAMRDKLIGEILKIDRSRLNGHPTQRLPGNASFCFQGVEGESLLLMLDLKGISASSGSACTSGSLDPSHVLLAIGLPHEVAHGSLRLSFGDYNTMEDIDYIIETLPPIIERLRSMSPPAGTPSSRAASTTTSTPNNKPGAQRPWNNHSRKDGFFMAYQRKGHGPFRQPPQRGRDEGLQRRGGSGQPQVRRHYADVY